MSQVWSSDPPKGEDASLGTLVKQLSEQSTRLIRDELRLAQAEMAEKAKKAGKGAGLAAAAGVVALFGVGALIATVAGVLALVGKKQIDQVGPVAPQRTVENVKTDIAEIKDAARP